MADDLTLESNLPYLEGLNVESLNVDAEDDVTLILNIPIPEYPDGQAFDDFVIGSEEAFEYATSFGIADSTTGTTYTLDKVEGSGGLGFDASTLTLVAQFPATFSNFTGTLQGLNPCFASGTLIATPHGAAQVETLGAGERVALHDGGGAEIVWVGHRRQRNGHVVRILTNALGHRVPGRDLVVSEDHALFLDGVLVQVGLPVNGETILRERRDEVVFYHLQLERHAVLLAEGAPAESYLDTGNRRQFSNCTLAYDPVGDAALPEPCAEMVFAGARLDAIRTALRPVPVA